SDVANRISASLARRDTDGSKPPHDIRSVFDVNVVKLKILACRHMQDIIGVLFRKLRQRVQLIRCQTAERNLDTLHSRCVPIRFGTFCQCAGKTELLGAGSVVPMPIVVALPITPSAKSGFRKYFFVHFAATPQRHLRLENVDLFRDLRVHSAGEFFLPGGHQATSRLNQSVGFYRENAVCATVWQAMAQIALSILTLATNVLTAADLSFPIKKVIQGLGWFI